jgi:EamA domain-containing membrane protein RarD
MTDHVLERAKAYVALVGAVATALLGIYGPDTQLGQWATVAVALATAFGAYKVPNKPKP